MRRTIVMLTALLLLPGALPGASAWHSEDEQEHVRSLSQAGDPRFKEDAGDCLEQNQDSPDTACTVHYAHFNGLEGKDVMNLQRPPECLEGLSLSASPTQGTTPSFHRRVIQAYNGFLQYDQREEPCERSELRKIPMIRDDVRLSPDVDITGYWYLSADLDRPDVPPVGILPCLGLEMMLVTGQSLQEDQRQVVAQGRTVRTVLTAPSGASPPLDTEDPCPGSTGTVQPDEVTEFRVDLGPAAMDIPVDDGLALIVEWHPFDPDGVEGEESAAKYGWKLHVGPDHANRIVLPVENAFHVNIDPPHMLGDSLYFFSAQESPWGHYDTDFTNVRFQLFDDQGGEIPLKHLDEPLITYIADHEGHLKPRRVTFDWSIEEEDLEPGPYTVRITGANWQHTAVATGEVDMSIPQEAEVVDSPVLTPFVLVLSSMLGLLILRRRT